MSKPKMRYLLIPALLLCSLAHADTIRMTGTNLSFSNLETINFQLDWDNAAIVPGTLLYSTQGTLGLFNLQFTGTRSALNTEPFPWINWTNEAGDMIQLALFDYSGAGFPRLGTYGLHNMQLWCFGGCGIGIRTELFADSGSLQVSSIPTPEPSTWLLTLVAMFSVLIFRRVVA